MSIFSVYLNLLFQLININGLPMQSWSKEWIQSLRFKDNVDLFKHLQIEALKSGFELSSKQALISPYGKFYCSNGDRTYGKKSNITNCQFQFTSTTEQTSDGTFVRIKTDQSLVLEHPAI